MSESTTDILDESACTKTGEAPVVLIVEDDEQVRKFAARVLERAGYGVLATGWPQEAIHLARKPGPMAAMILDVVLPQMSGIATATEIRRSRPFTPILFMSGYTVDAVAGATDFVGKPFTSAELVEAVERVIRKAALANVW